MTVVNKTDKTDNNIIYYRLVRLLGFVFANKECFYKHILLILKKKNCINS